jgi:hypothetical protein
MKADRLTKTNLLSLTGLFIFLFLAFGSTDTKTNAPSGVGSGTSSNSGGTTNTSAEDPKEAALRDIKLDFKWSKSGFGSIMEADFTITNPTSYKVKDLEVECVHSAPSGTVIDSNTRTIYEVIEPKSKKVIKKFNMGFIHSQAASSSCRIKDLAIVQ